MTTEITAGSTTFDAFVLRRIRVAYLRAKIITNEIQEIATALQGGFISPQCALLSLDQIGAFTLMPSSSAEAA